MKKTIKKSILAILFMFSFTAFINAQTTKEQAKVAIEGYCPVAYQAMHKAVKGKPEYSSDYNGNTYQFVNEKAKEMFVANPAKFLPKYDAWCATAMSMGMKKKSDPTLFTVYKGATYLFSSKMAKEKFDKSPEMFVKKADEAFAKLK